MKILFFIFVILLTIICLVLHFSVIADLKEITEDMNTCYDQFSEHMEVLAETLQVYHELLDSYQIPQNNMKIGKRKGGFNPPFLFKIEIVRDHMRLYPQI